MENCAGFSLLSREKTLRLLQSDKLCVLSPSTSRIRSSTTAQGQTKAHNGAKITKDADMHDCITTVVGMKVRDTIHFFHSAEIGF